MNYKKLFGALVSTIAFFGFTSQANAVTILTLDNPSTVQYQQTVSSPCIFDNSSCSNPAGFSSTLIPTGPAGETYNLYAPALVSTPYTVGQIRDIVGDFFSVGIDVNTANPDRVGDLLFASEQLDFFRMYSYVGGVETLLFAYEVEAGTGNPLTQLKYLSNGNGFSDDVLNGFSLAGLGNTVGIRFQLGLTNASDGREQFFLIAANGGPIVEVPEPGTTAILGLGLLGMGFISLRGKKKQS
jgi:hypothetical protein